MAGSSKRDARAVAVKTWHARALELRVQGFTVRAIAAELGKSKTAVHKAIEQEIREIPSQAVNDLRVEVEERSRVMLQKLMPLIENDKATQEDRLAAIDRVIRIDKELRTLHGADAPATAIVATAAVSGTTPSDARRVMRELFGSVGPDVESDSEQGDGEGGTPEGTP